MTEKSEFREMRSFDLAIRRAYFKAQIRRNYAKNVVINRSEICILSPVLFCIHFPNLTDICIIFPKIIGPGSLF